MWRSPTFWKRFVAYAVSWLLVLAALELLLLGQVQRLFLGQIEERLRAEAVLLQGIVRGRPAEDAPDLQRRIERSDRNVLTDRPSKDAGRDTSVRITLIADDGTVLADSQANPRLRTIENHANRPEVREARANGTGVTRARRSSTVHQELMYLALRTDDDQGAVAFVRVALPLDRVNEELARLRRIIWAVGLGTALAGMALIFWLTRRVTLTLQNLTGAAERIAGGDYGHKVLGAPGSLGDEVGRLALSFNRMSDRLGEQFARLEEDREQLRAILSGMVEGVVALDANQRILFANERASQLLEFQTRTAVGRKLWEVVRQRSLQEVVRHALAEPAPYQQELSWNSPVARSVTVHAARLPGTPPRGAVLVLHDTSDLRRLERMRQEFVANVSHELKTPLAVITACVETLVDGADEDCQHRGQFLQQISEQAHRLHALILDLLSLARIESGIEVFEFQAVPVERVVLACLERHRARAAAKNQTLEAIAPDIDQVTGRQAGGSRQLAVGSRQPNHGPLPSADCLLPTAAEAWADEEAVAQILDNLVDNALKYTPEGGRIQVRWYAEDDHVSLEVRDTGIGIPEQDLPRIFERFYRVDKARSRELGGTGLGLSIVKHLVQAMHGGIRADSRPGQGTTFFVRLPVPPAA
jgi:two-component system phosphate regulon sensor histidine kinase PhoR